MKIDISPALLSEVGQDWLGRPFASWNEVGTVSSAEGRSSVVQAAGGLVRRGTGRFVQVATVRRDRYAVDEWVLPKGRLQPGEDPPAAAIREVAEETGCQAKIREFAGYLSYQVGDTTKVVRFYVMDVVSQSDVADRSEVKEMRWLSPAEAVALLSHPAERVLLQDAENAGLLTARLSSRPIPIISRFSRT